MERAAFGQMLRYWRQHRRLSQLELSGLAGISGRHLSFLETGRSSPSREMVLGLAEAMDLPLREHNALLDAAGFSARYSELDFGSLSWRRCAACWRSCSSARSRTLSWCWTGTGTC
ncbi:MAG: helix-turn-helix transcriptional regulator [Polyangiaceae bacterium]